MRYSNKKTKYKSNPPKRKPKPLYVDSKEDPMYKAYSDSTAMHNASKVSLGDATLEDFRKNSFKDEPLKDTDSLLDKAGKVAMWGLDSSILTGDKPTKEVWRKKAKHYNNKNLPDDDPSKKKWNKGVIPDYKEGNVYGYKSKDMPIEGEKETKQLSKMKKELRGMNSKVTLGEHNSPDLFHEEWDPQYTYQTPSGSMFTPDPWNAYYKKPEREVIVREKKEENATTPKSLDIASPVKAGKSLAQKRAEEKVRLQAEKAKAEKARKDRLRKSIADKTAATTAKDKQTRADRQTAYDASRSSNTPVAYNQVKASGGKNRQDWIRAKKKK